MNLDNKLYSFVFIQIVLTIISTGLKLFYYENLKLFWPVAPFYVYTLYYCQVLVFNLFYM